MRTRRFTALLVLLVFIVSLAASCSGEDVGEHVPPLPHEQDDEHDHHHHHDVTMDVTMEAPDELFEYEAELVDERLEEEENEMDEQFLKNQEEQMLRDGDGEKRNIVDPEEILEQVEDIYAGFDEKKGWLFANYTSRVSTEKAVDALLQEGPVSYTHLRAHETS